MTNLVSAVMAWCPVCGGWEGVYKKPGQICLFDCENVTGTTRKLIRRRFYFCPEGPGDSEGIGNVGFLTRKEALAHDSDEHDCWEYTP